MRLYKEFLESAIKNDPSFKNKSIYILYVSITTLYNKENEGIIPPFLLYIKRYFLHSILKHYIKQ